MLPATSSNKQRQFSGVKTRRVIHNGRHSTATKEVRFPDIVQDAALLGVDRTHLYRVLCGDRTSRSLLARYRALKSRA